MIETHRGDDETKQATQEGPFWYVYQCAPSSELRGSNQRGSPCGAWRIWRRSKPILWPQPGENRPQGECTACGNRRRVTTAEVIECDDKAHAFHVLGVKQRGEA